MTRFLQWFLPTFGLLALDVFSLRASIGLASLDPWTYGLGLVLGALTFYWIAAVAGALPRVASWAFALVAAFAVSLLLAGNALLYAEFKQYATPHMLRFVVDDLAYLRDYAATYGPTGWGLGVLALTGLLTALWTRRVEQAGSKRRLAWLLALPFLVHGGHRGIRVMTKGRHVDALAATGIAVVKYQRQDWATKKLKKSERKTLAPVSVPEGPDVLLVLNESWDRKTVPGLGGSPDAAPRLALRLGEPRAFLFPRGLANATATDVSVPSIVSGVGPAEPATRLEAAPLAWDWAKAAGMRTLLVSSQRLTWNGLEEFLRTDGLDRYLSAPEIGAPVVNDLGIDDLVAADAYCDAVRSMPADGRLFSVFNSNALHDPYQTTSDRLAEQPAFPDPLDRAVAILDQALDRVIRCAEARRGETVVIMTGDHGLGKTSGVPRLYSFHPDAVGVPMVVILPESLATARPDWREALARNRERNVTNLDVVPTVIELAGSGQSPPNDQVAAELAGSSLLGDVPESRPIVALNTNDFKKIDQEGFGVYIGPAYLVVSDVGPPTLVDMAVDPAGRENLWSKASDAAKAPFLAVVESTFQLNRIYRHAQSAR